VQVVQHYGSAIAVVPAVPHYYAVRYYNPLIVFGPAWHPVRHVHWRPWHHRPVHHVHKPVHVHKPIHVNKPIHVHKPVPVHRPAHVHKPKPVVVHRPHNGPPSPAARIQQRQAVQFQQYHRIPEAKRQPIVQQHYRSGSPSGRLVPHASQQRFSRR
jgi:hypothetical protein